MKYQAAPVANEADLQLRVGRLATRRYGLLHYHTHDSRRSESGFPDSVFVGRTVLFRELKMTRRSRVRPDQQGWLHRLRDAGADAAIWYADDYHSGLIDEQLAAAAPRTDKPAGGRRVPPLALRVAKRLYLSSTDNADKAALLWEAGVDGVNHDDWINQAQHALAVVADELPAGSAEQYAWLVDHGLGCPDTAAVFTALRADLAAPATLPRQRQR